MVEIAAVVILYNPSEDLAANILTYLPFVKRLYICDNSYESHSHLLTRLNESSKIIYVHEGKNVGIAERLNFAVASAKGENFDFLLTMDQDSRFAQGGMETYLQCISLYPKQTMVAMFGVETEQKTLTNSTCESVNVRELITSGSVINLRNSSRVGSFDENLFIDEVDLDYCYAAILAGLTLVKFEHILLDHRLGEISFHRSIATFKLTARTLHSPIRLYYIVRNHFYLSKKYSGKFDTELKAKRKLLFNRLKNNLLYNSKRLSVIRYALLGYSHYKMGKTGRLPD